MSSTKPTSKSVFKGKLAEYKEVLDADIAAYSKVVRKNTLQQYGANARLEVDVYLDMLERGGKRIRGALTMLGYEMSGGKARDMIIQAARAVEMIHAYILIIDDIQDRSPARRGGPTAHKALQAYHEKHKLADSAEHFGVAMALNSALVGNHAAQMLLADLDVEESLRIKVIGIMNRTMLVTAHGQTSDIMNEVVADVSEEDVERVMEWKTAHYTILNPLHIGMVLAGADCAATDAITDYAVHAGKAFQITDDILGTFGEEFDSGKSPLDDTKEGKRTLLTVHALKHATNGNKNFLLQMLGNQSLTPEQFIRVKEILVECGALKYAASRAEEHVEQALASLEEHQDRWQLEGTQFLRELVGYLLVRTS